MLGRLAALHRYPIKGFSPERLPEAVLEPDQFFPGDRLLAVENGPCGFDPAAPSFISKTAFAVLAAIPEVALIATAYDPETGALRAQAPGRPPLSADLTAPEGRLAFAEWLSVTLGDKVDGPLKLVEGPPHRFTDHIKGHVSLLNLETVRALGAAMGTTLDPLRFRANLHVEGWSAFAEEGLKPGDRLRLGAVEFELFKPIARCAAIEVDPERGLRDLPVVAGLFNHRGHVHCGLYLRVVSGGRLTEGDDAAVLGAAA